MRQKTILNVSKDKNGEVKVSCPDSEAAVVALTKHICKTAAEGDDAALNILFSVTVHILALDVTGEFEEQYIGNIRKTTPAYRECARESVLKS